MILCELFSGPGLNGAPALRELERIHGAKWRKPIGKSNAETKFWFVKLPFFSLVRQLLDHNFMQQDVMRVLEEIRKQQNMSITRFWTYVKQSSDALFQRVCVRLDRSE